MVQIEVRLSEPRYTPLSALAPKALCHAAFHGTCYLIVSKSGQAASDFANLVAIEAELVSDKFHGRIFGRVKQVGALQRCVERCKTCIDRGGVDHGLHLAGLGGPVKLNAARFLVKTTAIEKTDANQVMKSRPNMHPPESEPV